MGSDSENRYYCYTDAGGTFTDTLLIDQQGDMWSGKAPTTPGSLDEGHIASIEAALSGLGHHHGRAALQVGGHRLRHHGHHQHHRAAVGRESGGAHHQGLREGPLHRKGLPELQRVQLERHPPLGDSPPPPGPRRLPGHRGGHREDRRQRQGLHPALRARSEGGGQQADRQEGGVDHHPLPLFLYGPEPRAAGQGDRGGDHQGARGRHPGLHELRSQPDYEGAQPVQHPGRGSIRRRDREEVPGQVGRPPDEARRQDETSGNAVPRGTDAGSACPHGRYGHVRAGGGHPRREVPGRCVRV